MDRVAHGLHLAADDLTRRIFASLPREIRAAMLIFAEFGNEKMAAQMFGKAAYAAFLMAHVREMPPVHLHGKDVPADQVDTSGTIQDLIARLPNDYGQEFGAKAVRMTKRLLRLLPYEMEDAFSNFTVHLISKVHGKIEPGSHLKKAEGYVTRSLSNFIATLIRDKLKREEHVYLDEEIGDSGTTRMDKHVVDEDPTFKALLNWPQKFEELKKYVNKHVHPDMGLYLDLLGDGQEQKYIIGDPHPKPGDPKIPSMLPTYDKGYKYFNDSTLKKLKAAMKDFLLQMGDEEYADIETGRKKRKPKTALEAAVDRTCRAIVLEGKRAWRAV